MDKNNMENNMAPEDEKYTAEFTVYKEDPDGGYSAPPPPAPVRQQQTQRPRKRVTREMARRRQLAAIGIVFFILILIISGCAKACHKDDDDTTKPGKGKKGATETTTSTIAEIPTQQTVTEAATEPPTEAPTEAPDNSNVKLTTREIFLDNVGDVGISVIQVYPNGSTERNEVWRSSDESIATVDSKGYITARAPGECYIILSFDNNPNIEIEIKVSVADGTESTGNMDAAPMHAAPAPAVYDNEGLHYIDGVLVANKEYTLPEDFAPGLDPIAEAQFNKLCEAAAEEGYSIYMGSNYRSYEEQQELRNNFINWYGQEYADNYAALPGESEHQTGLAIDCASYSGTFSETQEAVWLAEHAHEYGFIIRYPEGKEDKTGFQHEAWHIRYVGTRVAEEMHRSGLCLEEYLGLS